MTKETFDELKADQNVIKMDSHGICFFKDAQNDLAIQFVFSYNLNFYNSVRPESRVLLSTFPWKELNTNLPPFWIFPFKDGIKVMVNADSFEYALSYVLNIDSDKRTIQLHVDDMPELGESLIGRQEKNFVINF